MRHSIRHARRQGQPKCLSRPKRTALYAFLMGVGYGSVILNTAYALPGLGTVIGGAATVDTTVTNVMTVTQTTANVAIVWTPSGRAGATPNKAFDILNGETVTFVQPSATSIAWNQIVCSGCSPTQIAGTLQANGKVWLFDPNGIEITHNGVVNVAGFLASSLIGDPSGWLANTTPETSAFAINDGGGATPTNGHVTNAGSITATGGYVALVGNSVDNATGSTIDVGFGTIDLAAGRVATVTPLLGGGLNFALNLTGADALANNTTLAAYAVANEGSLSGAAIRLTANDANAVFASGAVNTSGVVRAVNMDSTGGTITLTGIGDPVLASGTLNAAGATAGDMVGTVQISGDSLSFGTTAVTGTLTATSTVGDINESGAVTEATAGTFVSAGNINLGTQANDLKNPTFTVGGANLAYRDVNSIAIPAKTLTGNLTLISDTGTITEGGVLNVTGNSSFTTSAAQNTPGTPAIDLSTQTNVLGGTVSLNTAGTDSAAIKAQALNFAASNVGGAIAATTTVGDITESGAVAEGTAGTLVSAGNINLGTAANNLKNPTFTVGGTNLAYRDVNSIVIPATALGGNLTLISDTGTITEGGVLNVTGNSSFTTSAAQNTPGTPAIDLSTQTNVFAGTVAVNTAGTDGAAIKAQALNFAASAVGGGLAATATTGTITQAGVLHAGGASSFTTSTAQNTPGTPAINLGTQTNVLGGTVALSTAGTDSAAIKSQALNFAASNVGGAIAAATTAGDITESGAVVEGAAGTFNSAGNINLGTQANNLRNPTFTVLGANLAYRDINSILIPATTLTGNLTLISDNGTITEGGVLNVTGNSSFTTSAAQNTPGTPAIDLSTQTNVLGGTVALNTAGTDGAKIKAQALNFAASNVGGTIAATTTVGDITESGAVVEGAAGTFTSAANINLGTQANNLKGPAFTVGAGGNLAYRDVNSIVMPGTTVGGNLTLISDNGTITEGGVLNVTGNSSFTTSAAQNTPGTPAIDLSTQTNVLGGTVALNTAGTDSAAIKAQALKFAASTVGGDLTATATTSTITETGALNVGGNSSFTTSAATGGTAIDLSTSTNALAGTVALDTTGADSAAIKAQALKLAASTVGGGLTATASTGKITQTGVLNLGGTSSFTTSAATGGTAIDLSTQTNLLGGTVALNTAGTDAAAIKGFGLQLAASTVGALTATATTGIITENGVLNVGGNSSFTTLAATGGTSIDLNSSTNVLGGPVALSTAGADSVDIKAQALNFAASNVGGAIIATTTVGDITESGAVVEGAAGAFNAAGNINLGTQANNLKNPIFTTGGGNLAYRDVLGIVMGPTVLAGNLALVSDTGKITETGVLNVGGTTSLTTSTAGGGTAIDLSTSTNLLTGPVTLNTAGTDGAKVTNGKSLVLAASTVGALTAATTAGTITQSGVLTVAGNSSFTTGAATGGTAIDLSTSTNVLGGTVALNTLGTDSAAIKAQALKFAASTVGGGLTATATTGTITETGALGVGGNSSFTTSAATGGTAIDLSTSTNALGGTVALNTAGTDSAAIKAQALKLAASTVGGGLTATAATGTITQTGVLNVGGNGSFTTSAATGGTAIDLSTSTNVLGGTVSLNTAGTDSAAIKAQTLKLAASTIGGGLTATATTGKITQTGALSTGGNSSFTTSAATGGTGIDLSTSTNVLGGTVALNTAGTDSAAIKAQALKLAASTVGGGLTATAATGTITQTGVLNVGGNSSFTTSSATGGTAIDLSTSTNVLGGTVALNTAGTDGAKIKAQALNFAPSNVGGAISATTTAGDITESGVVVEGAAGSFNAAGNVNLGTAANNLKNPAFAAGGGNLSYHDANAIVMPATTLTGTLALVSDTGTVTQSGVLNVGGTSSFSGTAIDLSTSTNVLGGAVTLNTAGTAAIKAQALKIAAANVGALTATATTGTIIETGPLNVTGNSSFTTSAATGGTSIDLSTSTNVLGGTVALNTAGTDSAAIKAQALKFAASNVGGNLTATATTGTITETGALTVGGNSSFTTGAATGGTAIDLSTSTNALAGTVALNTAGTDSAAIKAQALKFAASTVGGGLTATASTGTITETGVLTVGGNSSFTTSAATGGTAIDLSTSTNALGGTVSLNTAGTDSAAIKADLTFAASNVGGNLTATATTGTITETGVLNVGGNSSFTTSAASGGTAIDLSTSTNVFGGTVALNTAGTDGAKIKAQALKFAASNVGGAIAATTTAGDITESGAVTEGAAGSFNASGNVNLGTAANNLKSPTFTAGGGNVSYRDVNAIVMPAIALTGNLALISDTGSITEGGILNIGGTSSFTTSTAGQSIDLSTKANTFGGAVALTTSGTGNASITAGALNFGTSSVGGKLTATSSAGISESGPITTGGGANFTAANGGIDLSTSTNSFGGAVVANAVKGAVSLKTGALSSVQALGSGNVTINSGGAIGSLQALSTGGNIDVTANGAVTIDGADAALGRSPGGDVTIASTGAITQAPRNAGASTFDATNASQTLVGSDFSVRGNNVTLSGTSLGGPGNFVGVVTNSLTLTVPAGQAYYGVISPTGSQIKNLSLNGATASSGAIPLNPGVLLSASTPFPASFLIGSDAFANFVNANAATALGGATFSTVSTSVLSANENIFNGGAINSTNQASTSSLNGILGSTPDASISLFNIVGLCLPPDQRDDEDAAKQESCVPAKTTGNWLPHNSPLVQSWGGASSSGFMVSNLKQTRMLYTSLFDSPLY